MISALVVVMDLMSIGTEISTLLERYSNAIFSFEILDYWITERDGLWCSGTIQGLEELSCQDIFERPTGDSRVWY